MAEKILIMGESGTGKSTSIRNCDPTITAIVNPVGKPLPFRGSRKFETLNGETDSDKICDFMKAQVKAGKKMIIVDDFQYILAIPYMDRIKENGWDKWNDFGENYFKIIDVCKELPEDVCVYYLTHCETLENGLTTVKLIGKLLREKITIEGLFTIVLRTGVNDGKYYFFTQNSGKDTVKSPMGMFDSFSVDNDISYIDSKIRNYYEFDDAVSDAEIAKLDQEKAGTVEKPESRRRRGNKTETNEETDNKDSKVEEMSEPRKSRRRSHAEAVEENKRIAEKHQEIMDDATYISEDEPEERPFFETLKAQEEADDIADIQKAIDEAGEPNESVKPKKRVRKSRG